MVLVAHYDRAADSPGANDNSAAVFLLIETALKLRQKKVTDWMIIFTDKVELTAGEGLTRQGSYALAAGLRQAGLGGGRFFIFDACGTGDTKNKKGGREAAEPGPGNRPGTRHGQGPAFTDSLFR
jgi:hypothetical protein